MRGALAALTWAVLLTESLAAPLLLALGGGSRTAAASIVAAMHLGMGLCMELRGYSATVGAYLLLFLPAEAYRDRNAQTLEPASPRNGMLINAAAITLIGLTWLPMLRHVLTRYYTILMVAMPRREFL